MIIVALCGFISLMPKTMIYWCINIIVLFGTVVLASLFVQDDTIHNEFHFGTVSDQSLDFS